MKKENLPQHILDVSRSPYASLTPEHLEDLQKSGIPREAAKDAGIFSLSPDLFGKALALCGFSDGNSVKSIMVIPDYTNSIPQFKIFPPIRGKGDKPIKYLVPKGAKNHFWFAPGAEPKNGERLLFTEGRKKALALNLAGFPAVALVGVWSFRGKNGEGGTSPIDDFDTIPWEAREVETVFDSDAGTNPDVFDAEQALATELTRRGAKVSIVRLPMAPDGSKQGADDFLVAHGREAFSALPRTPFKSNQADKEDRKKKKQEKKATAAAFVSSVDPKNYDIKIIIKYLAEVNEGNFYPQTYVDVLKKYHRFIYCGECFYEYKDGVYKRSEQKVIEGYIKQLMGNLPRKNKIDEIYKLLAIDCYFAIDDLLKRGEGKINLLNGIFDVNTSVLQPHSPEYISIIQYPVNYNPDATYHLWEKTLNTCLPEDESLHDILQEWFGYCLTTDTKHEKSLFLVGEGANGKGTIGDTLLGMLGKDNYSSVHLADLDRGAQRAVLFGKLLNFASEISTKEVVNDSYFKSIVSGDEISAEQKYKDPFTFRPFCKLMFATNALPRVEDKSYAYFRRLIIIPFNQKFGDIDGEIKDKSLRSKLLAEIDGIFLWALNGLKRLEKRGYFTENDIILSKTEEYRNANNPLLGFLGECLEEQETRIEIKSVYKSYQEWCLEGGFKSMNSANFSKNLLKECKKAKSIQSHGYRYFTGIALSEAGNALLDKGERRDEKKLAKIY